MRNHWGEDVYSNLRDPPTPDEHNGKRISRQYLWLVSRVVGWPYALLTIFSFGFDVIRKFDELQRAQLLTYAFKHRDELPCQPFQAELQLAPSDPG